jgi:type VI secretion system secreted protein Hcp
MAIYMKYGDIKGSVATDGFKDWIMLDSFNWSVSRNVALPIRQEDTREGAEPNITEVVVSKRMEKASPKLWQEAVGGAFNTKATIRFTTTAQGKMESFLEYELTDTGLSSYSINSENPDGVPHENLTLNFAKVIWKYGAFDAKTNSSPAAVGWDLTKQAKQ